MCVLISAIIIAGFQKGYDIAIQANNAKVAEFNQKFLHIDEIDNPYIDDLRSYVSVSDAVLSPLTDDAVAFSAKLTLSTDAYAVLLQKNANYIVMTKSGTVFEYPVFGKHLSYDSTANRLNKQNASGTLATIYLYGISNPSEISYIKLVGLQLEKPDIANTVIKDNLEIELYSK